MASRRGSGSCRTAAGSKAIAFSPDGKILATGGVVEMDLPDLKSGRRGGEARLWQTATGRPLGMPLDHPAPVWSLAFSPGGRMLLTGSEDSTARLFLVATGALLHRTRAHEGTVQAVAISRDGKTGITASAGGDHYAEEARPPGIYLAELDCPQPLCDPGRRAHGHGFQSRRSCFLLTGSSDTKGPPFGTLSPAAWRFPCWSMTTWSRPWLFTRTVALS